MTNKENTTTKNILTIYSDGVNSLDIKVILKDPAVLAHALNQSKKLASDIFNGTIPVSKYKLEKVFLNMIKLGLFTEDFFLFLPSEYQTNHKILTSLFTEKTGSTKWIANLFQSNVNFNIKNTKLLLKHDLETYVNTYSNKHSVSPKEIAFNIYPTKANFKTFVNEYKQYLLDFEFNNFLLDINSDIFKHYTSDIFLELYEKDKDKFIKLIKQNYYLFAHAILPIEVYNHPEILLNFNSLNEYFFLDKKNMLNTDAFELMHENSNKHNQLFSDLVCYFSPNFTQEMKHSFILSQGEAQNNNIHDELDKLSTITDKNVFFETLKNNFHDYPISLSSIFFFVNPILKNNNDFIDSFLDLNEKFNLPKDDGYTKSDSINCVLIENYNDIPDNLLKKLIGKSFFNFLMIINKLRENEDENIEKILFAVDTFFSNKAEIINSGGKTFLDPLQSHKIVVLLGSLNIYKETLKHLEMTLDDVNNNLSSLQLSIEAMQSLYQEKKMREDVQNNKITTRKVLKF